MALLPLPWATASSLSTLAECLFGESGGGRTWQLVSEDQIVTGRGGQGRNGTLMTTQALPPFGLVPLRLPAMKQRAGERVTEKEKEEEEEAERAQRQEVEGQ